MRMRILLALMTALLCSACRADLLLDITSFDDGSGEVVVQLDVDADAVAAVPELADGARLDDIEAGGWTLEREDLGGGARYRATKPFGSAAALGGVVSEIDGGIVFSDAELDVTQGDDRVEYQLRVGVDPDVDPAELSDAELTGLLAGDPLGGRADELAAADVRVTVRASTPGSSNPVEQSVVIGDRPTEIVASSAVIDDAALALRDEAAALRSWAARAAVVIAIVAVLVAIMWLTLFIRGRRERAWFRYTAHDDDGYLDDLGAEPAPVAAQPPVPPSPPPPATPPKPGNDIDVDTGTWSPGETA